MKRGSRRSTTFLTLIAAVVAVFAWATGASAFAAAKTTTQTVPPFPKSLTLARYVYVASYDGDLFDLNLLPEDRKAISAVQDAVQKTGKFTLVYKPEQAEMILMVSSRPTEDVLAVYAGHGWRRDAQYLWRMTGRNGLQAGETPLVTNLLAAFDQAAKH